MPTPVSHPLSHSEAVENIPAASAFDPFWMIRFAKPN